VQCFVDAANNAIDAGFDGVEVHGANGYLLDNFLRAPADQRKGPYGGSLENRSRLLREVLEGVTAAIGADRTGVRISPLNSFQDMADVSRRFFSRFLSQHSYLSSQPDPVGMTEAVVDIANTLDLAYLHVMRGDFFGVQKADVVTPARKFKNVLIVNMGYKPEEAAQAVGSEAVDAVAFGTPFLANPDLPARYTTCPLFSSLASRSSCFLSRFANTLRPFLAQCEGGCRAQRPGLENLLHPWSRGVH
jgi:N-ethylmaleimide reductase